MTGVGSGGGGGGSSGGGGDGGGCGATAAAAPAQTLRYAILSLDVGSTAHRLPGMAFPSTAAVLPTRPIGALADGVAAAAAAAVARPDPPRVLVVGGGAAGVELAFGLHARLAAAAAAAAPETCGWAAPAVTLVTSAAEGALPPALHGAAAHAAVAAALAARGIGVLPGHTAVSVDERRQVLVVEAAAGASATTTTTAAAGPAPLPSGGGHPHPPLPFDLLVTATGAAAHAWLAAATDLPVDDRGFVAVGPTLQVPGAAAGGRVFAAGDCAGVDLGGGGGGDDDGGGGGSGGGGGGWRGGVPKAGVFAVRQGPVLAANIVALAAADAAGALPPPPPPPMPPPQPAVVSMADAASASAAAAASDADADAEADARWRAAALPPLMRFKPQRNYLALISTGDGRAIGTKWGLAFEGRWVWRLKDAIDRQWMRRFALPPPPPPQTPPGGGGAGGGGKRGAQKNGPPLGGGGGAHRGTPTSGYGVSGVGGGGGTGGGGGPSADGAATAAVTVPVAAPVGDEAAALDGRLRYRHTPAEGAAELLGRDGDAAAFADALAVLHRMEAEAAWRDALLAVAARPEWRDRPERGA
ncbi:hypothetical protein I4F81_012109 [Pyropia yezoensis]|uniref:Uncharacterized protein n=1 Tax=Pyropia yezoensis TaxID=2788 RepID=A0ACC3CHJ0_PYRYE|nr:hypothetical protein I4F81_012109 [Neopyropia yezoensis]